MTSHNSSRPSAQPSDSQRPTIRVEYADELVGFLPPESSCTPVINVPTLRPLDPKRMKEAERAEVEFAKLSEAAAARIDARVRERREQLAAPTRALVKAQCDKLRARSSANTVPAVVDLTERRRAKAREVGDLLHYNFGFRRGKLTANTQLTLNRAAKKHGATIIYELSCHGPRSWFSCLNEGPERNAEIERAVLADVRPLLAGAK